MKVFDPIIKFLDSLVNYLSYNDIFVIFVGLFLITTLLIMFTTSKAYESRLIKAIDMFNNYFIDNPQITDENLVAFNQKMKSRKVPKQLRKQWQQFVLYREEKASYYMSFENCVSKPIKNSSFKRDVSILNIMAHVYAIVCFVLNLFFSFEVDNLSTLLQHVLLAPAIILLLNYLIQIFLEVRHNAIVSDLHQNYQYFEANIDKATKTLPEYVDYEVLFDRNEIKKGIPILYTYLQKRAEAEQRELDLARLKNVEHEQFNFDEAGVAGSLVLERAMQEAENYIAERKKYNQDTEQINTDITQEEMNYREITKEYNRQMQVSRETFENFKAQLNEASSTIEANYLKKQQQQELDRQRNLERDFDTHTERHKKVLESFQQELDSVDEFRAQSRKTLEEAMMSEFRSYNNKVFQEAKKQAEQLQEEKFNKIKEQVKELEEKIVSQNKELENVYAENQALSEKLSEKGEVMEDIIKSAPIQEPLQEPEFRSDEPKEQPFELVEEVEDHQDTSIENIQDQQNETNEESNKLDDFFEKPSDEEINEFENQDNVPASESEENVNVDDVSKEEVTEDAFKKFFEEDAGTVEDIDFENDESEDDEEGDDEPLEITDEELEAFFSDDEDEESEEIEPEIINNVAPNSTERQEESSVAQPGEIVEQPKKRPGRPRKVKTEVKTEAKKRGRPRKEKVEATAKRKVGRPKKVVTEDIKTETKKRPGRPKKVATEQVKTETKRKVGRPKKAEVKAPAKRKVGRPKKAEIKAVETKKKVGRPKKVKTEEVKVEAKKRGRPRKVEQPAPVKRRGRPRKTETTSSVDFDAYLKEIDNAIAKENAKIKETTKQLEKKARISKRKK